MAECMNGSTGTVRHRQYTEAEYEVHTEEAFVSSTWCAGCLLEYVESGMGSCLQNVRRIRPVEGQEAQLLHERVIRALDPHDIEI